MSKIPQPEVRDSDFGDLATADQAALSEAAEKSRALAHYSAQAAKAGEMFKDADYSTSYEVSNRVSRAGDVWLNDVPESDDDGPSIESHVGDIPVKVYYSTDRIGLVAIERIEDDHQRDLPVHALQAHVIARLRRECEREVFA